VDRVVRLPPAAVEDDQLPRIVTWARLKDRPSGVTLLWFNTHWDHMGKVARVESGKLMRKLIDDNRGDPGVPVIVTGDFNSTEESDQYRSLTVGDGTGPKLIDAYRTIHPERQADEASFNGFKGIRQGMRIDWILHSPQWEAKGAAIEPLRVRQMLCEVVDLLSRSASSKNIKLELMEHETVIVSGLRAGVSHVLQNLVSNAIKYSPRDTAISITAKKTRL
jgi:hypothetical protein